MSRPRPPTRADPDRRRAVAGVAALILLRLSLDLRRLWADPLRYVHWEEAWNVTAGRVAWATGRPDLLLAMQNKAFCGGCSVVGALGGAAVEIGGDRLLAWKLVPLGWTAATLVTAFLLLRRAAGPSAAWAGLMLLAVPSRGLQELSLMAWGNHAESGLWILAALLAALAGPAWLTGLVGGLGAWFCRTTVAGGLVAGAVAAGRGARRIPSLLAGLAVGLLPLLVPQGDGEVGTYDLRALSAPAVWAERAAALLDPRRLSASILPGHDILAAGVLLGGLVGAALGAARAWRCRRPGPALPALVLAVFLAGWILHGTPLPPTGPGDALLDTRYRAPWLLLLPLAAAVAGPGWRRLLAVPALAAGILSQIHLDPGPGDPRRLPATDLSTWARVAAERLPIGQIPTTSSSPAVTRALAHARGLSRGLELARSPGDRAAAAAAVPLAECMGLGQGLVDHPWTPVEVARAHEMLARLDPPRARAVGRGMAVNLGFDVGRRSRDLDAQLRFLATGRPPGAPPRLAAAAARSLVATCRGDPGPCLAERLTGRDRAEAVELAWGAGAVLGGLRADAARIEAVTTALGSVDAAVAAAFSEAARDPVVHPERPTRVEVLRRVMERGRR